MLRCLRIVVLNKHMLLVANSLIRSVTPLCNMAVIIGIVWLMFGIVGVSFFRNRLNYCDIEDYYVVSEEDCLAAGNTWTRFGWNYDNIFEALVTLFLLTTMENWPNLVGSALDQGYSATSGPRYNSSPWMWIYFMLFIFISSLASTRLHVPA
jgi:hypothetical protein